MGNSLKIKELSQSRFDGIQPVDYLTNFGVWLSPVRAPALGAGGRRFESSHPDFQRPVTDQVAGLLFLDEIPERDFRGDLELRRKRISLQTDLPENP